jgi:hypothetical protein
MSLTISLLPHTELQRKELSSERIHSQQTFRTGQVGLGLDLGHGVGLDVSLAHKTRQDNFRHILHSSQDERQEHFGGYVWSGSRLA